MECANGHKLVDGGGTCQHSINSSTELIVVDGPETTGRVAKLVSSTTSCILNQFKRQVPPPPQADGLREDQIEDPQEQRPQRQSVGANLSQLFGHIDKPILRAQHQERTSKSTTISNCRPWSVQKLERSRSGNSYGNKHTKSRLTHTLSAPGSHVMHHNGCNNITVNAIQPKHYLYQYTTRAVNTATEAAAAAAVAATTISTTAAAHDTDTKASFPLSKRSSLMLGQIVQNDTVTQVSDTDEATKTPTVVTTAASHNRPRARVLKFNQPEEPLSKHGIGKALPHSSADIVNCIAGNHRQDKLKLNLSLASRQPPLARPMAFKPVSGKAVAFESDRDKRDIDVDGGYAWVVLAVIFFINASAFGTARAYGLIFDKLARDDDKSRAEAAMPFTIMGAVENMAGPLSGYLLAKTSNSWRLTVFLGSCLITVSHLLAALLVDSQLGQMLSLGLMCGLGQSLVGISFFQLNNAYFVRYRSTAFGLGMTGAAFGTLYISLLCQYFLDNYGTSMCYLMLSLILLPNVALSLLLKPKSSRIIAASCKLSAGGNGTGAEVPLGDNKLAHMNNAKATIETAIESTKTISAQVDRDRRKRDQANNLGMWQSVKQVICNPMFHLIWPTQLLFCWLNFVFGMIIVDFGRDRGLNTRDISYLMPCWAFGQLVGRLFLSSLIDLKFLTYKSFTVICLCAIGATTCSLNYIKMPTNIDDCQTYKHGQQETLASQYDASHTHQIFLLLVFVLSIFIALLFILFNGLVVNYVDTQLQPLSIGISSFTGSFFLLPRADVIGYYRDTTGNYDTMFTMFTYITLCAALTWLILPGLCKYLRRLHLDKVIGRQAAHNRAMENMKVYSEWQLTSSIRSKENRCGGIARL